jgi:hypothetical protein
MKSKVDKLKEIGGLLSSGAITQEEFVRLKAELLIDKAPVSKSSDVNDMYAEHPGQNKSIPQGNNTHEQSRQSVVVHHHAPEKKANGFGITGFVLALVGGFIWFLAIPFAVLGLIFSIIGMSKSSTTHKKGLAIAGFVISLVLLLVMILFFLVVVNAPARYSGGGMNQYY